MSGPVRVVSLLPSATEILCELGAGELLVGRSHECDFPAGITHCPVLTSAKTQASTSAAIDAEVRSALQDGSAASLYTLDAAQLRALSPDVILTQDLCEVCSIDLATVERLAAAMSPRPHVVSLNPQSLDDVLKDLETVGQAVGRAAAGQEAQARLRARLERASAHVPMGQHRPEVLFLEWMDPLFVGGHWTPELVERAGGRHSLNRSQGKSRRVAWQEVLQSQPDRVVICPCGFDLARIRSELTVLTQAAEWQDLPAVSSGHRDHVALVDGNQMFNRPGPRLVDALEFLVGWLWDMPELIPASFPFQLI
jgi:ABC-type Fe3+-hydroxamate transport system substrate-binding protein